MRYLEPDPRGRIRRAPLPHFTFPVPTGRAYPSPPGVYPPHPWHPQPPPSRPLLPIGEGFPVYPSHVQPPLGGGPGQTDTNPAYGPAGVASALDQKRLAIILAQIVASGTRPQY